MNNRSNANQFPQREQGLDERVTRQILESLEGLSFGAVEVTVHEGRVVQIDRRERFRVPPSER